MKTNGLRVHLKLFIKPILLGILAGLVWHRFFHGRLHFLEGDESALTDSVIPTIAMFHAIVAGHVLAKVWDEYKTVRHCLRSQDKDTFLQCKDDRIPMAIHMLLGSMSFVIQALIMMVHYDGVLAGVVSSSSLAFVLMLYWEVATNLDDPFKGVWYVGQIPSDWLKPEPHVGHK